MHWFWIFWIASFVGSYIVMNVAATASKHRILNDMGIKVKSYNAVVKAWRKENGEHRSSWANTLTGVFIMALPFVNCLLSLFALLCVNAMDKSTREV